MADYQHHELKSHEPFEAGPVKIEQDDQAFEATDRGLFGFTGKKKEEEKKFEEDAIASEFNEKFQVCEDEKEEPKFEVCEEKKEEAQEEGKKHESLLEKLHRSGSSSSSSSDEEEVGEGGEKKKKKKGLKERIKGKITGEKKEGEGEAEKETSIPVEKCDEIPTPELEEKKGFLDKIKGKLPGGKKAEEVWAPPPPKEVVVECATTPEAEGKEKKGFLDKIKEKLPGYHPKGEEEKKEKVDETCI